MEGANDRGALPETNHLGRLEPQGSPRLSWSRPGSHGICPVRRAARWKAPGRQDAERIWRRRVVEVVKDHLGDTFRAVYTLRIAGAVYVLHAFQKKSKTGRETPRRDMEMIKQRLREAEQIARESES